MHISSIGRQAYKLLSSIILIVLLCNFVQAKDDVDKTLNRLAILQSSEINLINAQLEMERWKHAQLERLFRDGFASWLELRRHQFAVDSITARLDAASDFKTFLSDVKTERDSVGQANVFRERDSEPIKVYFPGSVRLIGWIEGQRPSATPNIKPNAAAVNAAQKKLAKAQKRNDAANSSASSPAAWREKATLQLSLAKRELELLQAFETLPDGSGNQGELSVSIKDVQQFVTSSQSVALKSTTRSVAKSEASSGSHLKSIEILLTREQRRSDSVHHLHAQGHATPKELKLAVERVSEIKSQLNALRDRQKTLKNLFLGTEASTALAETARYGSANNWPVVVFHDKGFVMHLIEMRREYFNEKTIGGTAQLKGDFLQQVLDRLRAAPNQPQPNGQLGSVLNEGQRNEIESYEIDIEFAKANRAATIEKQQTLILEEDRFIQQTIAQHDAARDHLVNSQLLPFDGIGLLSRINPTTLIASNGNSKRLTHFSYLESGELRTAGGSSRLTFAPYNFGSTGSTYRYQTMDRLRLKPIESSLLTFDSRRSHSGIAGPGVEPIWKKYKNRSQANNSWMTNRMSSPPYYDAWPHKAFYGQYGYRARGGTYAYPNGILRADLRSTATPGQVPWYAPGSPANIRSNQLYYRREGHRYIHQ